jgi:hypothetical protein
MSGDVFRWKIFWLTIARETHFLLIRNKSRCTFCILIDVLDHDDLFPNIFNKGNTLHNLELNGNNSHATSCPFISLMHVCQLASSQVLVPLHHWFRDIISLNFVTNNCFLKREKKDIPNLLLFCILSLKHFCIIQNFCKEKFMVSTMSFMVMFYNLCKGKIPIPEHPWCRAWLHYSRQDR